MNTVKFTSRIKLLARSTGAAIALAGLGLPAFATPAAVSFDGSLKLNSDAGAFAKLAAMSAASSDDKAGVSVVRVFSPVRPVQTPPPARRAHARKSRTSTNRITLPMLPDPVIFSNDQIVPVKLAQTVSAGKKSSRHPIFTIQPYPLPDVRKHVALHILPL